MSSIVKGMIIRNTPDLCSSNNRLLNGVGSCGRRSTRVQWKDLQLRLRSSTWKGRRTTTYQLPIRGQAILTPTTPPTTRK
ncbi:phosphate dikinase chloroplastic-like, partial [Trifolium pratense]